MCSRRAGGELFAHNQVNDIVQAGVGHPSVGDISAFIHHHDPVADQEQVLQAVGNQDHAHPASGNAANEFQNRFDLRDSQRGGGFIHNQHFRVKGRRAGDGYGLALAAGHVKHGSHAIVADRSIQELTRDVDFFEADAVIATGQRTGDSATMAEIDEIRAATELPLLVGSGVTPANVNQILGRTQGVIVASTMKVDGVWWNDVELARVKHFMSVAQAALEEA